MTIQNIFLSIIWCIFIPIILGYGIIEINFRNKDRKNRSLPLALVLGTFVEYAAFQIISVPFTVYGKTFEELRVIWENVTLIITFLSFILIIINIKKIFSYIKEDIKKFPKVLLGILLLITVMQCIYEFKTVTYNYDDYNMLAIGNISRQTNTLFKYTFDGNEIDIFANPEQNKGLGRYMFSQFPNFTATLAEVCNMHTLVMAHTVFPILVIILAYNMFFVLGTSLFKGNYEHSLYFVLIMMVAYMFSGASERFYTVRLFIKGWQGKGICANIVFPFVFYVFIEFIDSKNDFYYWFLIQLAFLAGIMLSNVGMIVEPVMVALLTCIYFIKDRKFSIFPKAVFSVLPTLIYVISYLKLFGV